MSEQREADYYTGVETGIDLYQARMFAAEQRAAELNTQLQRLGAAVQSEVEYLETRAAEVEQFKQHRDADFEKWLKSRHGRRPVGAEGIELAAVVPQSAARRLREALHQTPAALPGERRLQNSVETCAELRTQLVQAERERDSYKESAESWSTRAAQEQLRAERAERELKHALQTCDEYQEQADQARTQLAGCSVAALNRDGRVGSGAYGYSASYQDVCNLRDRYDAARQSRARLVQLWRARGISARSWHASERTWKP